MNEREIVEDINRKRKQVLVHSFIYYRMGTSILTDAEYNKIAYGLAKLQKEHPDIAEKCIYAKDFANFDGTTSEYLNSMYYPWVEKKARWLLWYKESRDGGE